MGVAAAEFSRWRATNSAEQRPRPVRTKIDIYSHAVPHYAPKKVIEKKKKKTPPPKPPRAPTDVEAAGGTFGKGMVIDHEKSIKPATQGQGVSSRPWKTNKQRLNSMVTAEGGKKAFAERMEEKKRVDAMKAQQKEMIEERKAEKREAAAK